MEDESARRTRAARCPVCGQVLGVIYGDILVIQRGGIPNRTGLNDKIAVPCITRTCYGIWHPEPSDLAC